MKLLKHLGAISLAFLVAVNMSFSTRMIAKATTTYVTLGDINGDNQITILDVLQVLYYINGGIAPDAYELTAMDANQDRIIDKYDVDLIQQWSLYSPYNHQPIETELYTVPNNEDRNYIKYNVSSGQQSSYTLYAVSTPVSANIGQILNDKILDDNLDGSNLPDTQNTNVVQLSYNSNQVGSGFIIGSHVIATAAHCLYDVSNSQFVQNMTVNIYNSNGTVTSKSPSYFHIPEKYISPGNVARENYDYGLIYISDDLSQYGIWNVGIAVNEFMETGANVTSSGFCKPSGYNVYTRYYCTGSVLDLNTLQNESHNLPEFRIAMDGEPVPGKSGGVMYYDPNNTYPYKSAIAVTTGGSYCTWGCKLTPTLMKFYKHNTYLS